MSATEIMDVNIFISELLEIQRSAVSAIAEAKIRPDLVELEVLGAKSEFSRMAKKIKDLPPESRQQAGLVINEVKRAILSALAEYQRTRQQADTVPETFQDLTVPGLLPPMGHLHIVSLAISEITQIFDRIGFMRVRHPEVDWDWYAFEALNMPPNHPARDEWETFFVNTKTQAATSGFVKNKQMVLTPHTSNGQVREMEKGRLPIRMINIAKCYRRQIDISHTPMFHQFEGLYVDRNVSIKHLKGVIDYFVKNFYGAEREIRLRPFHFQFTEPSFEIDVTCGICQGRGMLGNGQACRLCKSGWLELGGAGMVHPNVIRAGGIDPDKYNGFAFGWGVERTYMMKSGSQLDDIRLLYSNDIRFLQQF